MGFWKTLIPHLAQCLPPLYQLGKRRHVWDWISEQQGPLREGRHTGEADPSSGVSKGGLPFGSAVPVTPEGVWRLDAAAETTEGENTPRIWSQPGRGSNPIHPIEQQLPAVYAALLQVPPLRQEQPIMVRTPLPVKVWVESTFHWPTSATAQTSTLSGMPACQPTVSRNAGATRPCRVRRLSKCRPLHPCGSPCSLQKGNEGNSG